MGVTPEVQAAEPNRQVYRLPDPPGRHPDRQGRQSRELHKIGGQGRLQTFLDRHYRGGRPVAFSKRYICAEPGSPRRAPDIGVALEADDELFDKQNGYIVSSQGFRPDFVLEIAAVATSRNDVEKGRRFYAKLGIGEYWRFDRTGRSYGSKLIGDRLIDGRYVSSPTRVMPDGVIRDYSSALGLYICWRNGRLDFYDPRTEMYIPSLESLLTITRPERERAQSLERLWREERQRADAAERRVRELETEIEEPRQ